MKSNVAYTLTPQTTLFGG